MLEPTLQSAFVVVIAFALNWVCVHFNIPISTEVLAALATAIVAWLFGTASGTKTANRIRGIRG